MSGKVVSDLHAQVFYVNVTKGYRFGDGEPIPTYTDNVGDLYKALRRAYL